MDSADKRINANELSRRKFLTYGLGTLGVGAIVGSSMFSRRVLQDLYLQLGGPALDAEKQTVTHLMTGITSLLDHSAPNFVEIRMALGELRRRATELSSGALVLDRWSELGENNPLQPKMYLSTPIVMRGQVPGVEMLWHLPLAMGPMDKLAWLQSAEGELVLDELYGQAGIKALPFGLGGLALGVVSRKEIHSLEDLSGLVVASPTKQKTWLADFGVVERYVDDLYKLPSMLFSGEIDLTMPLPHTVHLSLKTFLQGSFYYDGSWSQSVMPYELVMRSSTWNALSNQAQGALRTAINETGTAYTKARLDQECLARDQILAGKAAISPFPGVVSGAFAERNIAGLQARLGAGSLAQACLVKQNQLA